MTDCQPGDRALGGNGLSYSLIHIHTEIVHVILENTILQNENAIFGHKTP
nr:MAG TPA: hypothetical protein [Caudoviricetes sp.]